MRYPSNEVSRQMVNLRLIPIWMVLIWLFSCQQEKTSQTANTVEETPASTLVASSDPNIEELERKYQKKIDSLLKVQTQGNTAFQNQMTALTIKAEELEQRNKNLDSQIGQQANAILELRDSLESAISEPKKKNTSFSPIALTEESLDSLTTTINDTFVVDEFNALDQEFTSRAFEQEVDSLINEVDKNKSHLAERDERLDGVLSNLAIVVEPRNKTSGKGFEKALINALLSAISDDTMIVNQYKRGFYSKEDLSALIGDYQLRKTQTAMSGVLIIYRRKKKQDPKMAKVIIEGRPYSFPRNKIDTLKVDNVFEVTFCDSQNNCNNMAFSAHMTNYVEVSLRKNADKIDIKPVNQVLGEFYARQVSSARKKK